MGICSFKRVFAAVCVSGVIALSTATTALAATVNVTYQGSDAFGSPNLSRYLSINSTGISGGVYAGPFRLVGSNGFGNFVAFCIDLAQYLTSGKDYSVAGSSKFGSAVDANIDRLFTSVYSSISTAVQGAAFQVALWEIISDTSGSYNLAGGNFSVDNASYSASVIGQANQYLNGLATAGTGGYRLSFLQSSVGQDLVTISPVPLPAAAGMLGLGLASLFGLRRRRRKA
jgi:hypothetical protein